MRYHECDQISADLQESMQEMRDAFGVTISLSLRDAESLIERCAAGYPDAMAEDFELLLEDVLDRHEREAPFQNPMQRKGYKKFLGKVFGRRSAHRRAEFKRRMEETGFPM